MTNNESSFGFIETLPYEYQEIFFSQIGSKLELILWDTPRTNVTVSRQETDEWYKNSAYFNDWYSENHFLNKT